MTFAMSIWKWENESEGDMEWLQHERCSGTCGVPDLKIKNFVFTTANGGGSGMTLDEWLETKEIPDNVDDCDGFVDNEFVDGAWRIWAGHECQNRRMNIIFKCPRGTYANDVEGLSTGDIVKRVWNVRNGNERARFQLTPYNNRLAI